MRERLFRAAVRLAEAIPLALRAWLFEAVMLCVWAADPRHRRIARTNLRIAFPEMGYREASRIIRRCYVRMGTAAAEFVHITRMDTKYIEDHVRVEGLEHLRHTRDELGIGPLAMTGHFGNWEILSHVVGMLCFPVAIIVRPLKDPFLDRFVTERREWSGNRVLRKAESAREVLREVRRKAVVGILIDQNVAAYRGIPVEFFTKTAYTTDGIARLALTARTRIHPAFIFRDPRRKFHHTIRFGPPIPMDTNAPRDEEVSRLMRRCNEELERAIREDPVQWLWLHRRWKTRPAGEPDVYAEAR
jgi:Kdo2-lipid IVA lauroyltransferase/acyltransferase